MLMISLLRFMVLSVIFGLSSAMVPQAAAQAPAIKKEDLRWDNKPFSYWQTCWRTELKSERRLEALRALAAFGTRGYAEEAAPVILEIMKEYDVSRVGYYNDDKYPFEVGPKERIVLEGAKSLETIGAPVVPKLLVSCLDDPKVRVVANTLLIYGGGVRISPSDVPTLVAWSQAKDPEIADDALRMLYIYTGSDDGAAVLAALQSAIGKNAAGEKFVTVLVQRVKGNGGFTEIDLLSRLGPSGNAAIPMLVDFVKELAPKRQQALEDRIETRRKEGYYVPVIPNGTFRNQVNSREWRFSIDDKYKLSSDPDPARTKTILVIGLLANQGRAARAALPVLRDPNLSQDLCRPLREAVADAIDKIQHTRRTP
jgi:hypothetical protein